MRLGYLADGGRARSLALSCHVDPTGKLHVMFGFMLFVTGSGMFREDISMGVCRVFGFRVGVSEFQFE